MKTKTLETEIGGTSPTNGGKEAVEFGMPYIAEVELCGTADILFHAWNNEAVAEKSNARKGSAAKKTDNLESYVYRDDDANLCIPGEYLRGSIVNAAKFRQDPRSPRKSAADLFKAAVISLTLLAPIQGKKHWDYEDRRRVVIQRNAITRVRPAVKKGWKATFQLQVTLPEYVDEQFLHEVTSMAGKLIGLGDFRPTFGRFAVTSIKTVLLK